MITDEQGKTLEEGDAVRVDDAWWEFETRTAGKIRVEAWDLGGNVARQEA